LKKSLAGGYIKKRKYMMENTQELQIKQDKKTITTRTTKKQG
jgi:hypothetical protein